MSAPVDTPPFLGSLVDNQLCGVWKDYKRDIHGTYTTEGITKLCEGLKGSAVTSLKCATAPRVFAFVSAPLDTAHHPPLVPTPAVSVATTSDPREERRSQRASKATQPCSRWSRLLDTRT